MNITSDQLLDAIDSWLWYNGLAEEVSGWEKLKAGQNNCICSPEYSKEVQPIWMICVELFGDYGTSPRRGWLYGEKEKDFKAFIRRITKTWREVQETEEQ